MRSQQAHQSQLSGRHAVIARCVIERVQPQVKGSLQEPHEIVVDIHARLQNGIDADVWSGRTAALDHVTTLARFRWTLVSSALQTRPCFMTNRTSEVVEMSFDGSPDTAMTSAR